MESIKQPNLLIVILGPTASGKTALAIDVAQYYGAEIISCDARQFYREMNIGTAKPSSDELQAVAHHFINNQSIFQDYSVGDFETEVLAFLEDYYQRKKVAVMVGGSGLFARIVCEGVDRYPDIPEQIRTDLKALFEEKGIEALQAELKISDPEYYARVDLQNPHRLIRALEVCRATGKAFSSFQGQPKAQRPFKAIKIAIDWEREALYKRINQRVLNMMAEGLEQEAKSLYPERQLNALQTVGYRELFDYFDGNASLEDAIAMIQQNTRRYAKRQLTWLRKEANLNWVSAGMPATKVIELIESLK